MDVIFKYLMMNDVMFNEVDAEDPEVRNLGIESVTFFIFTIFREFFFL